MMQSAGWWASTALVLVLACSALSGRAQLVNENLYTDDVQLEDVYSLRSGTDEETQMWYTAIIVTAEDLLASPTKWVGLGISDPTSGHMLGSDIAVIELEGDGTVSCTITDRWVPFEAFPLTEAPLPFPFPDECDESNWELVSCQQVDGEIVVEVQRPFAPQDRQDREVMAGLNRLVYAWGVGPLAYHGPLRGSQVLELRAEAATRQAAPWPPADAVETVDFLFDSYTVPQRVTTYACQTFELDVKKGEEKHIVGIEAVVEPENLQNVHHFVLHQCIPSEYSESHKKPDKCRGFSPQGNPDSGCVGIVYAWARGMLPLALPENTGFLVNEEERTYILEIHYDNPEQTQGIVDASGVRLHLATDLREHDVGVVLTGDVFVSRPEEMETGVEYQHSCPSSCTSEMDGDLNIFGAFLHMHSFGQQMWTHVYDADGNFVTNLGNVTNWNEGFQGIALFDEPFVLEPGMTLETTCIYDTTKATEPVKPGFGSAEEMCMVFTFYWPKRRVSLESGVVQPFIEGAKKDIAFPYCGYVATEFGGATICGDGFIAELNLPVPFTHGFSDDWGEGEACPRQGPGGGAGASTSPTPSPSASSAPSGSPTPSPTGSSAPSGSPTPSPTGSSAPSGSPTPSPAGSSAPSGSPKPSPTGSPTSAPTATPVCFAGSSEVELAGGERKTMFELEVGDSVRTGADQFSVVYMFGHRRVDAVATYKNITTDTDRSIVLSDGHLLEVNGELKAAMEVKAGDVTSSGRVRTVVDVRAHGIFNPHTLDGMIVVNGVRASTYTTACPPEIAHKLLWPVRAIYRATGLNVVGSWFHADRAYILDLALPKLIMRTWPASA